MLPASRFNPFPGLRPFETGEEDLFFGREGQSEEILRRLGRTRFLAVIGASGSGKSSLIRAGLLPYLYGGFMARVGSHWRVAMFRPGSDPIGNLARALNDPGVLGTHDEDEGEAARNAVLLEVTLRRSGLGLIEAIRLARLPEDDNVLIIVDQFEELFRFADAVSTIRHGDDAAVLVKLLLEATRQSDLPIYVALTMRSDFIGDCARFQDLPEMVTAGLYLIPRMTRDQRRAAIEGPVRVGNAEVSRRLVNRLLNDVGDNPDQLPILQHALMRTWDYWEAHHPDGRPIDLEDYAATGGMAEALSLHADEAYAGLPDERHCAIARRLFQCLTEKGADNREVRHPTTVANIATVAEVEIAEVVSVIEHFRRPARSFLMPPAGVALDATSVIDISHESLIRGWKRLKGWVEEECNSAALFRRLAQTAELYRDGKAGLWRDPELQIALAWKENDRPTSGWAERYHPGFAQAMGFLETSRIARDAEARAKRQQRRRTVAVSSALLVLLALGVMYVVRERTAAKVRAEAQREAEKVQAEAKMREVRAEGLAKELEATQTLLKEAQRANERFVRDQKMHADLANALIDAASPLDAIFARGRKADALSQLGNHQGAAQEFTAILEVDPNNLRALAGRGYAYLLLGRAEDSVKDTEKYLEANPRSATAFGNLGFARAMLGQYPQAIAAIQRAIDTSSPLDSVYESEVAPDIRSTTRHRVVSAEGWQYKVSLYYELAVLDALRGSSRFAVALTGADLEAARHHQPLESYIVAINWAWLQYRERPADYGALAASGALWKRAGRVKSGLKGCAGEAYARFLQEHGRHHKPKYDWLAEWVSGEMKQADVHGDCQVATQAIKDPREPVLEALELQSQGPGTDAMKLAVVRAQLDRAIDMAKRDPKQQDLLIDLLMRRVRVEFEAKDVIGVRKDCRWILRLSPGVAEAYYYLARTDIDAASKTADYEAALKYAPADPNILLEFSDFLARTNPGRALLLIQKCVSIWPGSSSIHWRLAKLQNTLHQNEAALHSIKTAISLAPRWRSQYELRSEIEKDLGRDASTVGIHLAGGYRAAGDAERHLGHDGEALAAYLKGFMTASALPPDDNNKELRFEQELSVRNISDFLESKYSREYMLQFWQNIVIGQATKNLTSRAAEEVQQLSIPQAGRGQPGAARALWDTYMTAAAAANQQNDFRNAVVLLNSAVQLAQQMGPEEPRILLSRMMLLLTYVDLNDRESVAKLAPLTSRFDLTRIDGSLLPGSRILGKIGMTYYGRWKRASDSPNRLYLAEAERCMLLQWAIQQKVLPKQDLDFARTLTSYGAVLSFAGKLDDAAKKFQQALEAWKAHEEFISQREENSKRYSVSTRIGPRLDQVSEEPLGVLGGLAVAYKELGDQYGKSSREQEASAAYAQSEALWIQLLKAWGSTWPNHQTVASAHSWVADLYRQNTKYTKAREHYEKSLDLYEALEGPRGPNVLYVAEALAGLLRKMNHERKAQELEQRYQFRASKG
jgi:tetratricopeptide (TPR) repeat protein